MANNTILAVPHCRFASKEEALEKLSQTFFESGFVKESYGLAVLEREKGYPTGLPTSPFGVAIPHTDVKHVNKEGILIATLEEPVPFETMGSPGNLTEVQIIFLLAMDEPHKQLSILQALMSVIQNRSLLEKIHQAETGQDITQLMGAALDES